MTDETSPAVADQQLRLKRRMREFALLVPLIGFVLFLTPILNVFTSDGDRPFLTPLVLYIFGVWASLILGAFLIARRLAEETGQE